LLLLKCVDVNIYKIFFFKFVHYAYMYRMYDVFLFCIHVVVDVDDFFVLSFSQSHLVVVSYRFIITSCLTNVVFVAFLFLYPILFLLIL
jgi:hypothetical protein